MATRIPALIQLSDPRVAAQLVYIMLYSHSNFTNHDLFYSCDIISEWCCVAQQMLYPQRTLRECFGIGIWFILLWSFLIGTILGGEGSKLRAWRFCAQEPLAMLSKLMQIQWQTGPCHVCLPWILIWRLLRIIRKKYIVQCLSVKCVTTRKQSYAWFP